MSREGDLRLAAGRRVQRPRQARRNPVPRSTRGVGWRRAPPRAAERAQAAAERAQAPEQAAAQQARAAERERAQAAAQQAEAEAQQAQAQAQAEAEAEAQAQAQAEAQAEAQAQAQLELELELELELLVPLPGRVPKPGGRSGAHGSRDAFGYDSTHFARQIDPQPNAMLSDRRSRSYKSICAARLERCRPVRNCRPRVRG